MAIYETINIAYNLRKNDITIFSNSKSVHQDLQNINFKNSTSHLIHKIRDNSNRFVRNGGRIKLIWIPSHCGISGNERTDSLAKKAPRSGRIPNMHFEQRFFFYLETKSI